MLKGNESEGPLVPCSCYNSTATNDSSSYDKLLSQRMGTADLCTLPAKAPYYREVGRALGRWAVGGRDL